MSRASTPSVARWTAVQQVLFIAQLLLVLLAWVALALFAWYMQGDYGALRRSLDALLRLSFSLFIGLCCAQAVFALALSRDPRWRTRIRPSVTELLLLLTASGLGFLLWRVTRGFVGIAAA